MKVVITGASGFVGSALTKELSEHGHDVWPVYRENLIVNEVENKITIPRLDSTTDWGLCLVGADVVIHCAARVHVMNDSTTDPMNAYREVNVMGTLKLAQAALESGVQRFIFISSIKVNGESTMGREAYSSSDGPAPEDFYGRSKYEAEQALFALAANTKMEVVVIRPPLVYGPGVKANFAALCRLSSKPVPLPFSLIRRNKRSMIYIGNLVSLILECVSSPRAANQVFLASDAQDLSLAALITRLRKSFGLNPWLFPVPETVFMFLGCILGKRDVVDRLIGALQVDISHTTDTLGWQPPYTVEEALDITAKSLK